MSPFAPRKRRFSTVTAIPGDPRRTAPFALGEGAKLYPGGPPALFRRRGNNSPGSASNSYLVPGLIRERNARQTQPAVRDAEFDGNRGRCTGIRRGRRNHSEIRVINRPDFPLTFKTECLILVIKTICLRPAARRNRSC